MPRCGRSRKKKRTEKEVDVGENEKKRTPRCFVLKQGKVGDRVRDLVQDIRTVMMPNTAKGLRESKLNRIEDFIAVSSHLNVSHLLTFSTTKFGTYMKMVKLPQGPTLTFRVNNFSLQRDIRAAQKKPRTGERDYTKAPLQVLNGFGGASTDGKGERQLTAEMLRGLFPPVDVPNFSYDECRRTALFHYDKEQDAVLFRHFSVGRKQVGLQRGVSKLLRRSRIPKLGRNDDVADFVLSGGVGASESEAEDQPEEAPVGSGKVGIRLTEVGPRLDMQLIKAEDGVNNGAVLYHRYHTKTPSQLEILEAKARQRKKLKARNAKLDAQVQASKSRKATEKQKRRDERQKREDGEGEGSDSDAGNASSRKRKGAGGADEPGSKKAKRFHPFGWKDKKKGKADGGNKASSSGANHADAGGKTHGSRALERFHRSKK